MATTTTTTTQPKATTTAKAKATTTTRKATQPKAEQAKATQPASVVRDQPKAEPADLATMAAESDLVARLAAAKAEQAAFVAWQAEPEATRGTQPATPNLDAIRAAHQANGPGAKASARKAAAKASQPKAARPSISGFDQAMQAKADQPARGKGNSISADGLAAYVAERVLAEPAGSSYQHREVAYYGPARLSFSAAKWAAAWQAAADVLTALAALPKAEPEPEPKATSRKPRQPKATSQAA